MTNIITNPQERTRFLKFMAVGVFGAVIDFGIMNLFSKLFGLTLVWAGTISFTCAVISNFIWNRYWTYPDSRSRPISRQLIMFFVVNIAGLAIRLPILHFLEPPLRGLFERLSLHIFTPDFLGKNFTLAVAVGVVMLWNFFVNRYWTYNDVDKVKSMNHQPQRPIVPIYTSRGNAEAILAYPYLHNRLGEWIGWVTSDGEVYSVLGYYVGELTAEPRIIRQRFTASLKPHKTPPAPPARLSIAATIPLAPMMGDLRFGVIDILLVEPQRLHTLDAGKNLQDID
jgi:putative flippase GtrA